MLRLIEKLKIQKTDRIEEDEERERGDEERKKREEDEERKERERRNCRQSVDEYKTNMLN